MQQKHTELDSSSFHGITLIEIASTSLNIILSLVIPSKFGCFLALMSASDSFVIFNLPSLIVPLFDALLATSLQNVIFLILKKKASDDWLHRCCHCILGGSYSTLDRPEPMIHQSNVLHRGRV